MSSYQLKDCISSLESVDTKIRIADVRKAHEMTFHWLFDPSIVSFSEWLQNRSEASQPFYWIQGKPGSGKSTLMKFALKDPRTIDLLGRDSELPWTIVAFFFHDRGTSSLQKTLSGLLREVISSILSQLPQLLPLAVEMYRKLVKVHGKRRPEWDLEDLAALMRQIVGQRETRIRLLIFLDALDEHAGDNELLVQMLQEWRTSADGYYVNLKVCLASRPWNIFVEYLSDGPNLAIHHHTENDINVYTNARLRASIRGGLSKLLDPDSCASLTDQITAKAQGVFIWVSLVTDHLAKNIRDGTPYQTLKSMVAAMPEELEDLYEHTVARIDPEYTNETHIIFQMVLHSVEPLTLETLFHASRYTLRLYLHHDATDEVPDVDSDQGLRWLMSRGGGILDLSAGSSDSAPFVQFLHQTAKEYLQSPRARVLMERVSARFAAKTGPYFLALCTRSCAYWVADIKKSMLYYLKLVEIDRQMDVNIQMPIHYESSKSSDQVGCGTLWWLQQQEGPFFEMCKNEYIDRNQEMFPDFSEPMLTRRRYTYSFIVIMVAANLISLVERSLTSEMLNFIRDNMTASGGNELELCLLQVTIGIPSLIPAHLEDRAAMVRTLLSLGHPQDIFTPLRSFLVSEEREVYKPRGNPHTPLEFLVTRGDASPLNEDTRLSIAKMLLERGASVPTGLLHYCAEHDSAAMVRLLLQLGAATNVTDPYGWLPVEYAILRQDRSVLTAFLDHDPSILRVHPSYGAMQWERTLLPPIIPLMAFGHPGLAILLARLKILGLPVLGQEFASKTKQSVVNFDDDNVETQSALPGDVDSNISSHTE